MRMSIQGQRAAVAVDVVVPRLLALGETLRTAVTRSHADVEVRAFLRHDGLRYLQPFLDWSFRDLLELLPEAPGHYAIDLQWRRGTEDTGWLALEFDVADAVRGLHNDSWPHLVTKVVTAKQRQTPAATAVADRSGADPDATRLWASSAWESGILSDFEETTVERIRRSVRPGDVVYDVGANVGVYASIFSRLVGDTGRVYAFEANPVCAYFLQANRAQNGLDNLEILPVAISDSPSSVEFTLNYRNLFVGFGDTRQAVNKAGHAIRVPAVTIDMLISSHGLRPPKIVKIDIEGAEGQAVRGMRETLRRYRPIVLVEIHGRGPAAAALEAPVWDGYTFEDATSGRTFSGPRELHAWFPDACLQIIATPASLAPA